MTPPILTITDVHKSYGSTAALRGVSLEIAAGEIVVLLGPSGCGKTTLLRIVAGLERPDSGQLLWEGRDLLDVPVHQRGFGMVFQDYALFPHKDVAGNVLFGLRMAGWSREQQAARLAEVLQRVGLSGFEQRAAHELSGGEQQRVALARALAPSPRLLLLDEPLGALDRALRERLMDELRQILKATIDEAQRPGTPNRSPITALYVTHDQAEAFAIGDRVVVMRAGQIEQVDAPGVLYRRPATPFVARFLGMRNLLPGRIHSHEPLTVETAVGLLQPGTQEAPPKGQETMVLIRPDAGRLADQGANGRPNQLTGRVRSLSFRGRYCQADLEVNGQLLELDFEQDVDLPAAGEEIRLVLDPAGVRLLPDRRGEDRSSN